MKTQFFIFAALLSVSSFAHAEGQEKGGGDSTSKRMRILKNLIGENGDNIRPKVAAVYANVAKFPAQGKISAQMKELVSVGILEDIAITGAPYEFNTKCDENGVERSASTTKVNLVENPNQPRPVICINLRKLAIENATEPEVVGVLAHEHVRHYGVEDADKFGYNPIGDFVAEKYDHLTHEMVTRAVVYFDGIIVDSEAHLLDKYGSIPVNIVTTDLIPSDFFKRNPTLSVAETFGKCRKFYPFKERADPVVGETYLLATEKNFHHYQVHFTGKKCLGARFSLTSDGVTKLIPKTFSSKLYFHVWRIDLRDI